jgi:mono/diheme cytochrome c family protein
MNPDSPMISNAQTDTTSPVQTLLAIAIVFPILASQVLLGDETTKQQDFFESKIRPVLIQHCYSCHSADAKEIKGRLLLDTAAGLLKGGESGPALIAGKPDESSLIEALRFDGLEMPPAGRLPKQVVADFEKWVRTGAFDPRTGPARDAGQHSIDIVQGRQFWAFQPFKDTAPPKNSAASGSQSSIDAFVTARLESAGLKSVARANRAAIVRRLYFDLTGLPPSSTDLLNALEDNSDRAIETLVDRMLSSPQFGVNWGRHWLDVARYADSNGGDFNATFHNAWKYRDYVVASVNNDKPFSQFVREQIAGDLLPWENDAQRAEQLIATGF